MQRWAIAPARPTSDRWDHDNDRGGCSDRGSLHLHYLNHLDDLYDIHDLDAADSFNPTGDAAYDCRAE